MASINNNYHHQKQLRTTFTRMVNSLEVVHLLLNPYYSGDLLIMAPNKTYYSRVNKPPFTIKETYYHKL